MSNDLALVHQTRLVTVHGVFYSFADDVITRHLINYGAHTRNELAMVLDHVDEGDVVVDIGAHIGTFAVPIARKLGPHGKLLAIEGCAETCALLERNVGANGLVHRIQSRCAIVGQGPQQKLRRVEVSGNTGAGFYTPDPASEYEAIDARSLICVHGFARPNFIKIDVEGMELLVLRSIAPIIGPHRPKLYIEVVAYQLARFGASVSDLDAFLRSFGYRFYRNTGERNSANDQYVKTELISLGSGGHFFDVLALPERLERDGQGGISALTF
jgi:FkbM family methyltransferase